MKISSMKKSLLDYAIKGHLTSKFRRENPTLSAFAEIESFNAEIKQKRDLTQKALKKLESNLKNANKKSKNPLPFANADSQKSPSLAEGDLGGGLDKPLTKQEIKAEIATLKKELSKLKEIEVLNLTPPKTPPPSPLPQGEGESMVSPHAKKGESKEKSSRAIKEAFSLNSPTFTNSNSQKSLAGDVHTASPSPCGRGLGGGVNSPMSAIKPLTSELNSLNNGANPFPFPIPASWAWVKLGDICEIILGKTPPRDNVEFWNKQDYKWVSIADMLENGTITQTKDYISEFARQNVFKGEITKKGTLLLSFKLSIGKTSYLGFDGFHNEGIASIIPKIHKENEEICKKFLLVFLPIFTQLCETTGAIKGETLNKEKLNNLLFALPPLQEQKAIAQRLDILVNLANDFERTQEELKRIEKRIEKSLLKYAIEGHLSKRFRRENPTLSAFAEIESFNADIKQKRDLTQKTLKKLESSLKHEKDKKANLKAEITVLKKELIKLREITPLYPCHVESSPCQVEPSPCHVERSETSLSPCHVEATAETSHKNCHVERSETSLQESAKNRDISFATQTQYDKNLTHNDKESFPFPIPASWAWVKLGDICEISSGGTPDRNNAKYWENGDIAWLKIGDMKNLYINQTSEFITQLGLENSSARIYPKGTIIYSIFATLGEVGILNINSATNQALAGLEKYFANLDTLYLVYVLQSFKDFVSNLGRGPAQKNINQTMLKEFKIPLPPLQEQKAIALKLEALFAISKGLKVE